MLVRSVLVSLAATALAACSVLTSVDGLSGGPGESQAIDAGVDVATTGDATSDAGESKLDGGDASDASDAPLDAPLTNLLPQGTFEDGADACTRFMALTEVDVTRVSGGHEGAFACRLCAKSTVTAAYDFYGQLLPASTSIGDRYQTRIWARSVTGAATIESRIRGYDQGAFAQETSSNNVALDTTWKEVVVTHAITMATTRINAVLFGNSPDPGTCVLIDDWRVYKLAP